MSIHPTVDRFVDEPCHLLTASEDAPLYIPNADEVFALTGKRLIAEDVHQYDPDTPFNLELGSGPAVLGTFEWSGLYVDNELSVDLTPFFTAPQLIGDRTVYTAWRIRGLWRGGYMIAYYGTSPNLSFTPTMNAMLLGGQNFSAVTGGFALGFQANTLMAHVGDSYYFTGGNQNLWFPIKFQIEVGYGDPNYAADQQAGNINWPAFVAGIGTDLAGYRGWNPNYACFNGLANAPNVIAQGGCPFTGAGGYVPPSPPPDL